MAMRTSLNGTSSVYGVGGVSQISTPGRSSNTEATSSVGDDVASFSSLGSAMAASSGSGVRPAKVASIQAAMASGGYSVPSSAVAGRVVDSMLGMSA
jgi:anti-sigma28 factor (negative regulator of flagellin synthesis)